MNLGIALMCTRGMVAAEPSFRRATSMVEGLVSEFPDDLPHLEQLTDRRLQIAGWLEASRSAGPGGARMASTPRVLREARGRVAGPGSCDDGFAPSPRPRARRHGPDSRTTGSLATGTEARAGRPGPAQRARLVPRHPAGCTAARVGRGDQTGEEIPRGESERARDLEHARAGSPAGGRVAARGGSPRDVDETASPGRRCRRPTRDGHGFLATR